MKKEVERERYSHLKLPKKSFIIETESAQLWELELVFSAGVSMSHYIINWLK